jgi:hypothetical protein
MRQSIICGEVVKSVAVKERQPFPGAEPEKAARVANDSIYLVIGQAVGRGVEPEWQPLRVSNRCKASE